jgi:hypothetical protein
MLARGKHAADGSYIILSGIGLRKQDEVFPAGTLELNSYWDSLPPWPSLGQAGDLLQP